MAAENLTEELEYLKLDNTHLRNIIIEQEAELTLTSKLFNITFDLSPTEPTTLDSDTLTPFLHHVGSSAHLPDLTTLKNTSITSIGYTFGGPRLVKTVIKTKNNAANIYFYNPECRKAGVSIAKYNLGSNTPPILYCLNNYPILRHQVKCLSVILSRLKQEGEISSYSLNNFLGTTFDEKLGPLYSLQIASNSNYTSFTDAKCVELYKRGFVVPLNDTEFKSDQFLQLENIVRNHVLELSQSTSTQSMDFILKTPIQSKRRRRRQRKKLNMSHNKSDKMPPPPTDRDKNETEQPDTDSQNSSPSHTLQDSRPTTPLSKGTRPPFSGSCNTDFMEKIPELRSQKSEDVAQHNSAVTISPKHTSDLPVTPTSNLTPDLIVHNQITLIVPPMVCPIIPFAVSPSQIGTPPAPAQLTELLPPTTLYD
ncbi:MAG: hypothetical protein GY739_20355 [Mesoflavibacter sp.]|nr:hypothetical protein [Mesoflavibacter sp.]